MRFSINDFFSKCDTIRSLRIWSHLLKTSLMENFIFCAVSTYFSSNCCISFWLYYIIAQILVHNLAYILVRILTNILVQLTFEIFDWKQLRNCPHLSSPHFSFRFLQLYYHAFSPLNLDFVNSIYMFLLNLQYIPCAIYPKND